MNQYVLILSVQLCTILALIYSGTIMENTKFFYRRLPTFSSKMATIQYNITYEKYLLIYFPVLYIYTTEAHSDLQAGCISTNYGQLRNEDFWIPLNPRLIPYRGKTKCIEKYQQVHCSGKITIRDYIQRKFAFSVGFECRNRTVPSVRGLVFKFMITDQSNTTHCTRTNNIFAGICKYNYDYTTLGNLAGLDFDKMKEISKYVTVFIPLLNETLLSCYQNVIDLLCSVFMPQCDPLKNSVIHICKETCQDFKIACSNHVFHILREKKLSWLQRLLQMNDFQDMDILSSTISSFVNCNYLPSKSGSLPCFYKTVSCGDPPNVTNAWVTNGSYIATSTVEYYCQDETFHIQGNKTLECLYSGNWAKPPRCVKWEKTKSPLFVVLPLLLGSTFIYFVGHLIIRCRSRIQQIPLTRIKDYDAFVCYAYEGDDVQFAEETIRTQLEEERQFKLCIHRRDFLAAWDIMWNINNAIKNSNSAIIVMSQDYINSLWCKEEFEQCYMEHMKDPAFKLFVIMMEPVENLKHISVYMERFFSQKTYLLKDDPSIFKKIAAYLSWVKEPKENCHEKNNTNPNVNTDSSDSDAENEVLM